MADERVGRLFHDEVAAIGHDRALQIRRVVTHRDQRCIAGRMFGTNGEHRHCQLALRPCLVLPDRLRNRAVIGEAAAQATGAE